MRTRRRPVSGRTRNPARLRELTKRGPESVTRYLSVFGVCPVAHRCPHCWPNTAVRSGKKAGSSICFDSQFRLGEWLKQPIQEDLPGIWFSEPVRAKRDRRNCPHRHKPNDLQVASLPPVQRTGATLRNRKSLSSLTIAQILIWADTHIKWQRVTGRG